jgi:peptidoglycan hydrolase-like protein with peptidoglycan-binding domain
MNDRDPLRPRPSVAVRQTRQSAVVAVLVASAALGGLIAYAQGDSKSSLSTSTADTAVVSDTVAPGAGAGAGASAAVVAVTDPAASTDSSVATTPAATDPAVAPADGSTDLDEPTAASGTGCLMTVESVRLGATGDSVSCLQGALAAGGYYTGAVTGTFDQATETAVRALQKDRDLFVDGVAGRESGISLDIWPAEGSQVVHTPAPPAGAKDSMGFPLSTVSSTGADAPPLPPNSGTGKRLVYDRAGQRVWAVSADEVVIRSWLVSGSKYSNEEPGVHKVYSKSEKSTAWNGKAILPHMVRYQKTDIGNIGFHGIPIHVSDGTAYETEAELGQRLSGGCQRQANRDADFVWAFADIGTTVVVI